MGAIKEHFHDLIEQEVKDNPIRYEGVQCVLIFTENGTTIISSDEYQALDVKPTVIANGFYEELDTMLRRIQYL